jgi:Tol biopolymer transport system component
MPDSIGIVYLSHRDNQLYFFDTINRNEPRRLTDEAKIVGPMAASADGRWIVFQSTKSGSIDLFATPMSGGEVRVVASTPHQDQHPFLSPSGRWLYFEVNHKNLWRVPGPAQDWKQAEPQKVTKFPESGRLIEDSQLSRDGRWLLYSRLQLTGDIWVMRLGK